MSNVEFDAKISIPVETLEKLLPPPEPAPVPAAPPSEETPPPSQPQPQSSGGDFVVATSAEQLRNLSGRAAILMGHHEGSDTGGGIYLRQEGNEQDNGATHIGKWVLQAGQAVTPYHFGAIDGLKRDSLEALQAYFDFFASDLSKPYKLEATGEYGVSQTLNIRRVHRFGRFDLTIQATEPLRDVILFDNCGKAFFHGQVHVTGNHGEASGIRLGDHGTVNGVRIEACRAAKLPDFDLRSISGWGIYQASGNSNMVEIGKIVARDCGATNNKANRQHTVKVESATHDNRPNINQRTYLKLTEDSVIPDDAHMLERSYIVGNWTPSLDLPNKRLPYRVVKVDRENRIIEVYPRMTEMMRVDEKDNSPEVKLSDGGVSLGWVFGGAVLLKEGGHIAQGRVGSIAATRCGTGLWLSEPSTPCCAGYVGQFCGVDLAVGKDPGNILSGGFIESGYFEACQVASIIQNNQQSSRLYGTVIGSVTSLDEKDIFTLGPQTERATPRGTQAPFLSVMYPRGGRWNEHTGLSFASANQGPTTVSSFEADWPTSRAHANHQRSGNAELRLRRSGSERLRGQQHITYTLYGNGKNGEHPDTFRVYCDEGQTINGKGQELVLPRYDVPVTLSIFPAHGNDWLVSVMKHELI